MGTASDFAKDFVIRGVVITFSLGAAYAIAGNHVEEPNSVTHPTPLTGRAAINMVQGTNGPRIGRTPRAVTDDVINRSWTPTHIRIAGSSTTSAAVFA